jgi:hypothetical protein
LTQRGKARAGGGNVAVIGIGLGDADDIRRPVRRLERVGPDVGVLDGPQDPADQQADAHAGGETGDRDQGGDPSGG